MEKNESLKSSYKNISADTESFLPFDINLCYYPT